MAESSVTPLDLEECEREPIHIPGAIQPHGVLLAAADSAPHEILQASANVEAQLGLSLEQVLGASLVELFEPELREPLATLLTGATQGRSHRIPLALGGRRWDAMVHRSAELLVLELEPTTELGLAATIAEHDVLRELTGRILTAESAAALHRLLPAPLRRLTGYERVMVYLFDDSGDGAVVAEDHEPSMEPYLDLHYPASDIPAQARRLYVSEPTRLIVDARYDAVPLVPVLRPDTGGPLDLSHAVLRSVSPIHCAYLANMGVRGSMSISLVDGDRLFGLIAFHHRSAHLPRYELREACATLGRVAAFVHLARTREQTDAAVRRAAQMIHTMIHGIEPDELARRLLGPDPGVLDLIGARAAIVRSRDETHVVGDAPPQEFAEALSDWLLETTPNRVYATDQLAAAYPAAAAHLDTACGVLALTIAGTETVVAWLRPEVVRTVTWGGDPNQPAEIDAAGRLGPRRSFALWREQVRGQAPRFESDEREIAECLRRQIEHHVVRQASELDRLNRELQAALAARDDFLSIASHELKTPLSTLLLTIESLQLGVSSLGPPDDRIARRLDVAKRQVLRLDQLVTGLLDVSRIQADRLELELADVDLVAIVHEVVERLAVIGERIVISGPATLICRIDRLRVDQVVTNLISNAVKYGADGAIEVELEDREGWARMLVRDHGPGIPTELCAKLFERFVRAREGPGTSGFGLGLWIARAIVRAHDGQIHIEDTPGGGTTMVVELPCRGPDPERSTSTNTKEDT